MYYKNKKSIQRNRLQNTKNSLPLFNTNFENNIFKIKTHYTKKGLKVKNITKSTLFTAVKSIKMAKKHKNTTLLICYVIMLNLVCKHKNI
jgi:hypothetical protein